LNLIFSTYFRLSPNIANTFHIYWHRCTGEKGTGSVLAYL
jgi:hypothetical protein